MIKVILIISKHSGCGQTTVAVNLASGLLHKGYRVLIGDTGQNGKLHNWLGINQQADQTIDLHNIKNNAPIKILNSRMGIDLLDLFLRPGNFPETIVCVSDLGKLEYDYLLLQPTYEEDCRRLNTIADAVIACTDLSHANELEELLALEKCLQASMGKANSIDLILPNKINTKEWKHNSQQLFALADYFRYEKIADPLPT